MNTKIGWTGLGKMGVPMSLRLLRSGYPVTVYNRTIEKEEILLHEGALSASSPSELIMQTDLIVLMVADDRAVRDVFLGKDGLLSPDGISGKIIVNMSTVSAGISVEMAGLCLAAGHHYLDAPVSGSVRQAESGELVVMAGGEKDIFDQIRPVLDVIGKLAVYAGTTGSGNTMKLAVNALLGIISQGLAEVVLFAKDQGLETSDLLKVIQNSALGNVYMKIKGEAILQDNYQAAFALKHIAKDLRLAKDAGFCSPLGKTVLETFQRAEPEHAEEDIIAVIKALKH